MSKAKCPNCGHVFDLDQLDAEYEEAVKTVILAGKASTTILQRNLRIGYGKAARIMEKMIADGVIAPRNNSNVNDVLISNLDELKSRES